MIKIYQHKKRSHEVCFVANKIGALIDSGVAQEEIAVIYRKNSNGVDLMDALIKNGVPVVVSQKKDVMQQPQVQMFMRILTYISLELRRPFTGEYLAYEILQFDQPAGAVNEAVKRIMNEKIKWGSLEYFQEIVKIGASNSVADTMSAVFKRFFLERIKGMPDYINILSAFNCFFDHINAEARKDRVKEVMDVVRIFRQMEEMDIRLPFYSVFGINKGVALLTAHSSKGLEYEHVFIIDAIDSNWEKIRSGQGSYSLPDTLTISVDQEEADRRLFYVAITRAKKMCYINFSEANDDDKPLQPSRFVHETGVKVEEPSIPHNIEQYLADKMSKTVSEYTLIQEKEFVGDLLESYRLSPSHLNAYMECPYGFYHKYVLRIPGPPSEAMMYGNAIHNTVQKYYEEAKAGRAMSLEDIQERFVAELGRYRNFMEAEAFDRKLNAGRLTLDRYFPYMEASNKITVNEFSLDVDIEGAKCFVKIDKMEFDGVKVRVIDYKTGKVENTIKDCKQPDDKEPLGGKIWRQLMFYRIGMDFQNQFPYTVHEAAVDVLDIKDRQLVPVDYTIEQYNMMVKLIGATYAQIKSQDFNRGCGECEWCLMAQNK